MTFTEAQHNILVLFQKAIKNIPADSPKLIDIQKCLKEIAAETRSFSNLRHKAVIALAVLGEIDKVAFKAAYTQLYKIEKAIESSKTPLAPPMQEKDQIAPKLASLSLSSSSEVSAIQIQKDAFFELKKKIYDLLKGIATQKASNSREVAQIRMCMEHVKNSKDFDSLIKRAESTLGTFSEIQLEVGEIPQIIKIIKEKYAGNFNLIQLPVQSNIAQSTSSTISSSVSKEAEAPSVIQISVFKPTDLPIAPGQLDQNTLSSSSTTSSSSISEHNEVVKTDFRLG